MNGNDFNVKLIEDFMKENNLSKTKFCKLCKVSPSVLNKILKNKDNFYPIALCRIAKFINVPLHKMFV